MSVQRPFLPPELHLAEVIRVSSSTSPAISERRRPAPADPGGRLLMLVPTGICVMMFVVAAWW